MNSTDVKDKLKNGFGKFFNSSKKALGKAGSAVQDFSDKSVIKIEIRQLEQKKKDQIEKLGQLAWEKFQNDDTAMLSASEEPVVAIRQEIERLNQEISKRSESLKKEDKSKEK